MRSKPILVWLFGCAILVYLMVVIGGITRVTGSGLSMVQWQPVTGILPPLNEREWQEIFNLYKETPEYKIKNTHLDLAGFKDIFFWEYLHRLLGRIVGLAYALPLAFFWFKGMLRGQALVVALVILFLGAGQGFLGWYMVKSGLVDQPQVSPYRLASHLGLALAILSMLGCFILQQSPVGRKWARDGGTTKMSIVALILTILIVAQVFWGALTAGTKAGMIYNTFPSMNGLVIPPDIWALKPLLINFFENPVMVQFLHRTLGWVIAIVTLLFVWVTRPLPASNKLRMASLALFFLVFCQFGLGIATLLSPGNNFLACVHQSAGTLLLLLSVLTTFTFSKIGQVSFLVRPTH